MVAFSQPLTADRDYSRANDEPVTLKVMGALNVVVWDSEEKRRKVVPMRWGFPTLRLAHSAADPCPIRNPGRVEDIQGTLPCRQARRRFDAHLQ